MKRSERICHCSARADTDAHIIFQLKLSVEHSGFTFAKQPSVAAEMLEYHSGGKVTHAFKSAMKDDRMEASHTYNFDGV
jgi:hypothetical protein